MSREEMHKLEQDNDCMQSRKNDVVNEHQEQTMVEYVPLRTKPVQVHNLTSKVINANGPRFWANKLDSMFINKVSKKDF